MILRIQACCYIIYQKVAQCQVFYLGILEENISRCPLGALPLVLVLAR